VSSDWLAAFPALGELEPGVLDLLSRGALPVTLPPGTPAYRRGDRCENFLFIIAGRIRVQQVAANGREIVLYRLGAGDTCILTTVCLFAHERYAAEAIAETEVRAMAIPARCFHRLIDQSARFRDVVFATYAARMTDLMVLVREVAFGRVDGRLARRLVRLGGEEGGEILRTHGDLAVDLGTAREVISRQLKEFERRGWVRVGRGRVVLRDIAALDRLAHDSEA